MALTLAQIRAKLQAQQAARSGGANNNNGESVVYPHWDIPEGTNARIRFLPDADTNNPYFWVERAMIRLPFQGVKGDPTTKETIVQVPCIEMYEDIDSKYKNACPILAEVRTWFNNPDTEELGRKYWKKRSYIFQGFVRENPLTTDKAPENPIRRFTISPQIFNIIQASLLDPEMDSLPIDYEEGLDFLVKKTSKGGYADYSTSSWARRESPLTQDELDAIEQYGLFNLKDARPNIPTTEELEIIKEMFEASVNGEPYDPTRWGKYYRPFGLVIDNSAGNAGTSSVAPKPTPAPAASVPEKATETVETVNDDADNVNSDTAADEAPTTATSSSTKAQDILAMIRNAKKTA